MDSEKKARIDAAQYQDELRHKARVYDGVKATLELCTIMIQALEPTTDMEKQARKNLVSYLDLSRQYALMSATDVTTEMCRVKS